MSKNRILRHLLITLVLVGLAALFYGNTTRFPRQEQRLPDGSTLRLEAVTYGPEHRLIRANWGLRLLRPLLPAKTWEALGGRVHTVTVDVPEAPVVWFVQSNRPAVTPTSAVTVFDEHGCEARLMDWTHHGMSGPQSDQLISCSLSPYPRCGRQLGLRIYAYERHDTAWQRVAEFRLPLSLQPIVAPWSPVPVPVTVRDGDLSCTLTRFVTGSDAKDPSRPVREDHIPEASTYLTLKLQQDGRKTPDWRPVGVEARGPAGELFDSDLIRNIRNQGVVTEMQYPWNLFPRVSAWNLRVELARTETAPFAAEELWTIPNVAISPPSGALFTPGVSMPQKRVGEGTVALMDLRRSNDGTSDAGLILALTGLEFPGTWVTLVRAVDDRGREGLRSGHPGSVTGGNRVPNSASSSWVWFKLPLRVAPQARTVDVTVAVHRTRFIELTATPTWP